MTRTTSLRWHPVATGKGCTALSDTGTRWTIRGPIMGKPVFWLYRNTTRVQENGCSPTYSTLAAAKRAASRLDA